MWHASPDDLFPRSQKPSYREEIPATRCTLGGQPALASPLRARSYAMSDVLPFPYMPLRAFKRLGPTNSGPVYVAQKPCSSSAPRMLTWINATSIGICNTRAFTLTYVDASQARAHPPTPPSVLKDGVLKGIGGTVCDIHFRGPTIRQGSCNTLINGCLLLGTPTCCLNRWTLFMVSIPVHLVSLAQRMVQPISP